MINQIKTDLNLEVQYNDMRILILRYSRKKKKSEIRVCQPATLLAKPLLKL